MINKIREIEFINKISDLYLKKLIIKEQLFKYFMIRLITQLKITQPAYVYLPFGYNKNHHHIKYNILYLMHGWEHAGR